MVRYIKLNSCDKQANDTNSDCTLYLSETIPAGSRLKMLWFSLPNSYITFNAAPNKHWFLGVTCLGAVVVEFPLSQAGENITFSDFLLSTENFFSTLGITLSVTYDSKKNQITLTNNSAFGISLSKWEDIQNSQYNFYSLLGMTANTTNIAAGASVTFPPLQYIATLSHSVDILISECQNSIISSNPQTRCTFSLLNNTNVNEILQYNSQQYEQITIINKNTSQLNIKILHPQYSELLINVQNWECLMEIL